MTAIIPTVFPLGAATTASSKPTEKLYAQNGTKAAWTRLLLSTHLARANGSGNHSVKFSTIFTQQAGDSVHSQVMEEG